MTDRKRIAWELERTAMGDGYYGDALRLADECEESARAWANEIDTRERAAAELRRLHAQSAQDEALLRQALEGIELHLRHHERGCVFLDEIALALRERLGEGAER